MNYTDYKVQIGHIKEIIYGVKPTLGQNDFSYITETSKYLDRIYTFLEDEYNIELLIKYGQPASQNDSPLCNLCLNLINQLDSIYELIMNNNFVLTLQNIGNLNLGRSNVFMAFYAKISDNSFVNKMQAFSALKHLDGHNKTLIILGPNGSGKTSFANYLRGLDNHVKVIPACKPIKASGFIPNIYNSTIENYNSEIYSVHDVLKDDVLQKLIIGLCTEHDNVARTYYDTNSQQAPSTYQRVKEIFDGFFDVKLNDSNFANKEMRAQKGVGEPFAFNDMSDGERSAFFYIATVISAPKQSFIIVDEPENHLNPAIYNKIWDKLIGLRTDCQFIFISHTIEFINGRTNFELVKIKKFEKPNYFEFDFLGDDLKNLSSDFIVEIVGSRKPILFCEGSKTDYDYRIYEKIFGAHYTIIPIGNCKMVENSVVACNLQANKYNLQSAIGIIDSDLKSENEIKTLVTKKVYPLQCNEIEMLLLDEAIFKMVLSRLYKSEKEFENFKNLFFAKMAERGTYIVKRLVKTQIDELLKNSFVDDKHNNSKEAFNDNLTAIFDSINVNEMWDFAEQKLNNIIEQQNYDEALKFCCLEHNEVLAGIANQFAYNYADIALGLLGDDYNLANQVKNKYFPYIGMN